jgi:hypothetical protein
VKPFLVLGEYHPPKWSVSRVGQDLTNLTFNWGLSPHIDPIHGAQEWAPWVDLELHAEVKRRTTKKKAGEDWHYDGDTTDGADPACAIVLWASNTPTEFRFNDSEVIHRPKAREVVLFHNLNVRHRRPADAPKVRWTFRQRMKIPSHLELP